MKIIPIFSYNQKELYVPQARLNTQNQLTQTLGVDSVCFKGDVRKKPDVENIHRCFPNEIKAAFCDIDGTLLDSKKMLPQSAKESLIRLNESGIPLILVSGRTGTEMAQIIENLPETPDYLITQHGAVVMDREGKVLYEDALNPDSVTQIVKASRNIDDPEICLMLYTADGKTYQEKPHQVKTSSHIETILVKDLEDIVKSGASLTKIAIRKEDSKHINELLPLRELFKDSLDDSVNMFPSSQRSLEVISTSASKGKAASIVSGAAGINLKNAVGIGDAGTDVDLMREINQQGGLSIAMGNSVDSVMQEAKFSTSHVDEGGFARAVDAIICHNSHLQH